MTDATVRGILTADRERTVARVTALTSDLGGIVEASASSNADDEHDPEGSTIAFERAQVVALLEQARRHLTDLDRALQRLDEGTYATCERCGRPIAAARLAARPAVRTCITCASATAR